MMLQTVCDLVAFDSYISTLNGPGKLCSQVAHSGLSTALSTFAPCRALEKQTFADFG